MRKIVVSHKAAKEVVDFFKAHDFQVVAFPSQANIYSAVADHPDMFIFYDGQVFVEGTVDFQGLKCEVLSSGYPNHIKYNIAKVGNRIICKYDSIARELKVHFEQMDYEIIDVKQGYSKCSTAIVDENTIITSDKGIYNAVIKSGIDALLIAPGHIALEGLDYGFIGGCCVAFDDLVFFSGDISKHPDYKSIETFVHARNKRLEYTDTELRDYGSFIIIS